MADSYPNWRKGVRKGIKWGLILSVLLTLPHLFVPQGDPINGHVADAWRHEIVQPEFWFGNLCLFAVYFGIIFVIAAVIAAFRPD